MKDNKQLVREAMRKFSAKEIDIKGFQKDLAKMNTDFEKWWAKMQNKEGEERFPSKMTSDEWLDQFMAFFVS